MNGLRTPGCEPRRLRFAVPTLTPLSDGYMSVFGTARNINEFSRFGKTCLRSGGENPGLHTVASDRDGRPAREDREKLIARK